MHYVYILKSLKDPDKHYTGLSHNPKKRLEAHNRGRSNYSTKYKPWELETVIGFKELAKAKHFEIYLKSHSGRAFSSKHF
ncbi:MAG: GIY-YIG nuclease family protein [Candidatus Marinimicrobia bacterium]|nr:GIY-YIG nuclease family protein [Candidatus Neomarinimicrobiota bacterium]MCF7905231.1 GIY-YIG nuclease family protein [Candidatus Neomarinimicrobiota bacterium]